MTSSSPPYSSPSPPPTVDLDDKVQLILRWIEERAQDYLRKREQHQLELFHQAQQHHLQVFQQEKLDMVTRLQTKHLQDTDSLRLALEAE